jgi:radical SAM-linked protein
LIPKTWFVEDWNRATELRHAKDCRHRKCHDCGVIDVERELCATMLRDHVKARVTEAAWERKPSTEDTSEPVAVQRLWLRIGRTGEARHLAHLEAMNAWLRALRRAKAPLAWSQGFHPHPKMAFAAATPMGQESVGDYLDISLVEVVDPDELRVALAATLPAGFEVTSAVEAPLKAPSLMSLNEGAEYEIELPHEAEDAVRERVEALAAMDSIMIERKGKSRSKAKRRGRYKRREAVMRTLDIRPMIRHLSVDNGRIRLSLQSVDGKPGKAREIVPMLTSQPELARVRKADTLRQRDGELVSLSLGWS